VGFNRILDRHIKKIVIWHNIKVSVLKLLKEKYIGFKYKLSQSLRSIHVLYLLFLFFYNLIIGDGDLKIGYLI
jgi:hypothetical protein